MFNLKVVKNCPVTRASQGRVTMPPWLIAECVGTLEREKGQEWLILLKGYRSADGMDVQITGAEVPPDQKRTPTHVHLDPLSYGESEVGKEHLTERIIGALHSHNEMSAVFSGTDDKDINQKFEVSIVISSRIEDDESTWLGFSYDAVGKVKLPCGSLGMVNFKLVPEGVEDWPLATSIQPEFDSDHGGLGDCCQLIHTRQTVYKRDVRGKCEITEVETQPLFTVFGEGEGEMSSLLPPPITYPKVTGGWKSHEPVVQAYIDADFEEEVTHVKGLECECCGEKTGKYKLIGKDLICYECVDFWTAAGTKEPSEAAWIKDWDEDRLWQERWAEVYERGGC